MPRRGNGEGSIRERSDGRWEGRLSWTDGDGKLQRASVYGKTRKAVQEEMRERLRAISRGYAPRGNGPKTVAELLERWMDYRQAAKLTRPTTQQTNESRIRVHLAPGLGRVQLVRLRPRDIERFYVSLHGKVGANTVRGVHSVLHAALRWAQRQEWIVQDPSAAVDPELTRRGRSTVRALTLEEVRAVIRAIEDEPDRSLWVVALTTGLRFGELAGLKWQDVNLTTGVLRVERTVSRVVGKGLVEQPPKTPGSIRSVLLPTAAREALWRWHYIGATGHVWTMPDGGPIYQTWANRRWHAIQSKAGIPRERQVRLHDTRRTVATLEMTAGLPKITQARLGHAAGAMTLHYQDVSTQQPVVDHVDRMLAEEES